MNLQRVLSFARTALQRAVRPGDIVIDATIGNGHDTVFLAELVGETGHVYGFDIQEKAINQTKQLAEAEQMLDRITLFQTGHEQVKELIPTDRYEKVTGAIFNLGYLPGGDKSIVTKPDTTISAVEQLIQIMPQRGTIILVVYHGHPEGATERDALLDYTTSLDQDTVHVLQYGFINQKNNPPFIIAIEKK